MQLLKKGFTLLCITALFSTAALAHNTEDLERQEDQKQERMSMLTRLAFLAVGTAAIKAGTDYTKAGAATTNLLHAVNVLWQLGEIAEKPVFKDLSMRTLLAGISTQVSPILGTTVLPQMPFVGKHLAGAGDMGKAVTLVATYQMMVSGFDKLCQETGACEYLGMK